jgi:hypothetical protein
LIEFFEALQENKEAENDEDSANNSSDLVGKSLCQFIVELLCQKDLCKVNTKVSGNNNADVKNKIAGIRILIPYGNHRYQPEKDYSYI